MTKREVWTCNNCKTERDETVKEADIFEVVPRWYHLQAEAFYGPPLRADYCSAGCLATAAYILAQSEARNADADREKTEG